MVLFEHIEPWFYLLTLHIKHHGEVGFPFVILGFHGVGSAVGSLHSCDVKHCTLGNKTMVLVIMSHLNTLYYDGSEMFL